MSDFETTPDPAEAMAKILHDDECRSGKACGSWEDPSHRYTWERKVRRLSPVLDAMIADARSEGKREFASFLQTLYENTLYAARNPGGAT